MLFQIAEGSEFRDFCDDAKAKAESPALLDSGAEASVTNNEDFLNNLREFTAILEGFNGAAAKAQGQGNLTFSTRCYHAKRLSGRGGRRDVRDVRTLYTKL